MDNRYVTKSDLYHSVDHIIDLMNITINDTSYPLDSINLAHTFCNNLELVTLPFPSTAICGVLCKDESRTAIALNKNREDAMRNFDCMHELVHYFLHDDTEFRCICPDKSQVKQNNFIEWQANEGAAQALVPYQIFIPEFVKLSRNYARSAWDMAGITIELAHNFYVSPQVIRNRINNLEYEIKQYLDGIPIEKITLLSKNQITKRGLHKKSTAIFSYCTKCLSVVSDINNYCSICGTNLKEPINNFYDFRVWKGVGYMKYDGIQIDQKYKAIICPRCNNEEIEPEGNYCKICGIDLVNKCAGYLVGDGYHEEWISGCSAILDGKSRNCPFCGKPSSFYNLKLLRDWNYREDDDYIPF
ncbi:ImmA/IrrE family metallo-endopeptidase [Sporomusa sphaeroides]|uniref:Double zinc ribbon n=1 Tax=Sporomusa sphaeroides DSM 2875 TaxID=1337886 RepID=A0ABP2C557_9FIRM|nr:ImmA/IrrE family metallo-endopeptidase [Sporomusa sphaeroides]OLS56419.1 double zinc ribbon [Sporomusa sphaeroides DSM 2875]CVK18514.1 Double zinc ribbon [Sporomusa sphaeroides DSM 2875]